MSFAHTATKRCLSLSIALKKRKSLACNAVVHEGAKILGYGYKHVANNSLHYNDCSLLVEYNLHPPDGDYCLYIKSVIHASTAKH